MQGHDSGYYTQAEVNDFLSDMQAQFDCAIAELRDEIAKLMPRTVIYQLPAGEMTATVSHPLWMQSTLNIPED